MARQINGEMVFVKVEKAFKDSSSAEKYLSDIGKSSKENIKLNPNQAIECSCERGIFDIEIDE